MRTVPDIQLELQSLRDEIGALGAAMLNVQARLDEVTRQAETEKSSWQFQIEELQNENRELLNTINWLRTHNRELERLMEQRKPEMDNILEARNAAIRRLRHAQRVIRDLLDERLEDPNPDPARNQNARVRDEDIQQALNNGPEEVSSGSSNSDRTVQPGQDNVQVNQPPVATRSEAVGTDGVEQPLPQTETPSQAATEAISTSTSASVHPTRGTNPNDDAADPSEVWRIYHSKPPKSSTMSIGPLGWRDLPERLKKVGIDEDRLSIIRSLEESSETCLRLQIVDDVAFIYDPIFLESELGSYLIDWGEAEPNRNIKEYIDRERGGAPILHTFVFPVRKGRWYYIGAHTWTVTRLWPVWPTLGERSRRSVVEKLVDRSHGQLNTDEVTDMLDGEMLEQLCVDLSGHQHQEMSREFGRKMGYRGRPGKE